jgi:DNA (cytosine-5)-methyltransferase 1
VLENNFYKEKNMKLKLLDLFSGIGGFSLGLESTGFFETIAFVEKDKFCQKVLKKNFNNIPIEEDIRNVKGERYAADVITGGFPCQPFSVAGKRKGTDDDRYLWDETIRVVRECKPRWFIGENVEGIINIQDGMVLRQVCTDLEEEGFEVQCLIIPASGIGAWHQRKRVWILAYSNNNGSYRQKRNETIESSNEQKNRLPIRNDKDVPNTDTGFGIRENQEIQTGGNTIVNGSEDVSNSDSKLSNGCGSSTRNSSTKFKGMECNQSWEWNEIRSKAERCSEQNRDDVQHSNNQRCEESNISKESNKQDIHSGKFDSTRTDKTWWEAQSELCGVPNGISYELDKDRANRIKSLGNSIVPQIARELGLAIMKAELNETR